MHIKYSFVPYEGRFDANIFLKEIFDANFDVSSFTSKDTIPPKAQHVLATALFSKSVQDMKVKFDMTTRHKTFFGCLQATHSQDFLLAILIDGLG